MTITPAWATGPWLQAQIIINLEFGVVAMGRWPMRGLTQLEITMISPANGEVSFANGLCICAHSPLPKTAELIVGSHKMSVPGWTHHPLGIHRSDHGEFEVHAITSDENRVEALYLSHCHSFYEEGTQNDAERRVYHESVIATDLRGQTEFSWGQIFCRVEPIMVRDWIWVVYNPFSNIPLRERSIEKLLAAHEPLPSDENDTVK